MRNWILVLSFLMFLVSCKTNKIVVQVPEMGIQTTENVISKPKSDTIQQPKEATKTITIHINDTTFVNLKWLSNDFVYDLKYATTDNFLKTKVYDCDECYLRYKTAKALIKANKSFIKEGYRIKLFDCYRPKDVQQKMWQIVSNPIYVANPKKGSIHNRGGAVDLTLVDKEGKELEMGTGFDHFGPEAAHGYQNISEEAIRNRKLLRKIMEENHFTVFDSEWWHYNLKNASKEKLSNFKWTCP